ncbi:hypothetical protein FD754_007245 [Muntiacus muntjak]|uniref:Bcl-2 Bcl-2 homology region 1-3 domain-containing protein n=1 Tax=Muntiacus muntjak TaxID=9888 RepID=A0A5N3WMN6_MUNMU|nr:hypothetical protein FD754_007245 [Muntiacus muntjak]
MGLKRWNPRSPRHPVAEEELDGCESDPLGKRPAVRPLPLLVGGASNNSPGSSREGGARVTGAKDAKPPGGSGATSRRALETLRRVGDGVQRNHKTTFQGMLRKLDIKNEDDVRSLSRVMVDVFSDGVTNWGRIVTLISFGAFVAKHLKSINQESCIEPLAESITDVLLRSKGDWIVKQRGWDGFVEFFHVEDLEGGIRNVLLAFAGVAGVGAGLAYLIR